MIKQRQNTLLSTMGAIMHYQKDFFLTGDETTLKPMILKDIAEITGLDISTVSRVANSKFVQTEFGTYRLKFFFSESLSTDSGEEVSTREVKKILSDLVEAESKKKPLSDERLTELAAGKRLQYCKAHRSKIPGAIKYSCSKIAQRIIMKLRLHIFCYQLRIFVQLLGRRTQQLHIFNLALGL